MSHPPLRDEPGAWPVVTSRDLHRDDWVVALREDRITVPDGSGEPFRRLVLEHPGAAIVLAVDEQERVLCLWQYRHATQRTFVEIPAGLLDGGPDESPLESVRLAAGAPLSPPMKMSMETTVPSSSSSMYCAGILICAEMAFLSTWLGFRSW